MLSMLAMLQTFHCAKEKEKPWNSPKNICILQPCYYKKIVVGFGFFKKEI